MRGRAVLFFLVGVALECAVVGVIAASVYLEFAFDTNYALVMVVAGALVASVGFVWGLRSNSLTVRVLNAAAMLVGLLVVLFVVSVAPLYANAFDTVFVTLCGVVGLLGGVAFRESRNR